MIGINAQKASNKLLVTARPESVDSAWRQLCAVTRDAFVSLSDATHVAMTQIENVAYGTNHRAVPAFGKPGHSQRKRLT